MLQSKLTFKPFNQYEKKRSQKYKRQTTKNNEIKAEKCNENHYRRAWFVIWSWQLALHIYFLQLVIFSVQENGFSKFQGFSNFKKNRKEIIAEKGTKWNPSGIILAKTRDAAVQCQIIIPSTLLWKAPRGKSYQPQESFCLLTSQWYYCLIFYPPKWRSEKQSRHFHTKTKESFSLFIILFSKNFCS